MSVMHEEEVKSARGTRPDGTKRDGKTREVVGKVRYPIYDSLDESVKALSEPVVLGLVNTQVATDAKNRFRADAVGVPSEKALQSEALNKIINLPNGEGIAMLQKASGDPTQMAALMAKYVAIIKTEKGLDKPETEDAD